jgi:hypothetical protein
VDPVEGRDGRVEARQFHGDKSIEKRAAAGATIAVKPGPDDIEIPDLGDQLERERVLSPKLVDHGSNPALHEGTHPR